MYKQKGEHINQAKYTTQQWPCRFRLPFPLCHPADHIGGWSIVLYIYFFPYIYTPFAPHRFQVYILNNTHLYLKNLSIKLTKRKFLYFIINN